MVSTTRARVIALAAAAVVVVALIAAVLLLGGGDEGVPEGPIESREPPNGPGFVWLDGQWLEPPYTIVAADRTITLNGTVVRDRTVEASEPPVAPADPATAEDLVEVALARLETLGGPSDEVPDDATVATLRDEILQFPAAADVRYEPPLLQIEDRDGNVAAVILQVLRPATDAEVRDDLAATAEEWRAALDGGAALLLAQGETVTVQGWEAPDFFAQLTAVFDMPDADRAGQMLEAIGAPMIAEQMLTSGAPPPSILDRVPQRDASAANSSEPSVLRTAGPAMVAETEFGLDPARLALTQGAHGDYRTPGKNRAYFFTTFTAEGGSCPTQAPIKKAARLHNYRIIQFDGRASTVTAFAASSGLAGIYFGCMHGGNSIEFHSSRAAATAALNRYRAAGSVGLQIGSHGANRWYVMMGRRFINARWRSNNTIVQLENCGGGHAVGSYNAREFIATFGACTPASRSAIQSSQQFWGRLDGTLQNGRIRPVGVAFRQAYGGTIYRLQGSGMGMTVLVPAVREIDPEVIVPVSPIVPIKGFVKFDAQMDQRFGIGTLITLSGTCGATLVDGSWRDAYTFDFRFTTTRNGTLWFNVSGFWAASGDEQLLFLDGNQRPGRTDHVGPSRDNFSWAVECVSGEVTPTPFPTSTPPPTPTATPEPTATPTPGVKLTISPGEVSIYTVVFDDAATEGRKAQFDYDWALAVPSGDDCTAATFAETGQATASWDHSDCEHSPGEVIRVLIRFPDGVSISIFGPAIGVTELRP